MCRAITLLGLTFLVGGLVVAADPPAVAEPPKLPEVMTRSIVLGGRAIENTKLTDVLDLLRKKHECDVKLDSAAFEKPVGERKIRLPKMASAPAGLILEMIARQVDGTIKVDGNQLTLVPGEARELKTLVGTPHPKLVAALVQPLSIDRAVVGAPFKDILEFLSDKYSVNIVVDESAFAKAGTKDVGDSKCNLAAGAGTLRQTLDVLAGMVKGTVIVGNELILIVPAPPAAAPKP